VIRKRPKLALSHVILTKSFLRQGNLAAAKLELMPLARDNPSSPDIQLLLGEYYFARNEYLTLAGEAYERALKLRSGGSFQALASLVNIDHAEEKAGRGKGRIEPLLAEKPDDEQLLLLAGSTFVLTGEPKRAEDALQHAFASIRQRSCYTG
jgi:tetratricopeptide (TPR) repeat protein